MVDAPEVTGEILDLPALLLTDLVAFDAAARTHALLCAQFVHVRGDGKIFEVLNPAPALAPPYSPQFFFGLRMGRKIGGVDRLAVQRLGEAQQQLRQIPLGLETIPARPVIPLLQAAEFYLQMQILQVQTVGTLLLLRSPL